MATTDPKKDGTSDSIEQRPRRRRSGLVPLLLLVLLVIAMLSFFQSIHHVHHVSTHHNENTSLRVSLEEFKQSKEPPASAVRQPNPLEDHSEPEREEPPQLEDGELSEAQEKVQDEVQDDDVSLIDRIREDPIPNPPLSNGTETFSSCLLVMDDNHRLVEWMAYHYHVLPLRYLIIAVDPRSRTSPTAVLNRWRKLGVVVEEWDDMKFMKVEIARNAIADDAELQIKRDRHRMRQKTFYKACLERLKTVDRTWVTLIDTDEFLTYNHKGGSNFEEWEARQQKLQDEYYPDKERIRPSQIPPTTADPGALLPYIRQEAAAGLKFYQKPCISCPRLQFGARESTKEEQQRNAPDKSVVDPERLDTLRYRKHAERQDFVKNGLSKSLLDVSRIDKFPRITTLHRPIKTICPAPWRDEWSSGLRINHYLGSWEAYSFRDDSRRGGERSIEGWAFKAQDADETDDNIRPWIGGFVKEHGKDKSQELLQGAGLPRGYKDQSGKNWTILFLDEILSVNKTKGNDVRKAFDSFVRDFHQEKNQSGLT